jgi:hypothetical protein
VGGKARASGQVLNTQVAVQSNLGFPQWFASPHITVISFLFVFVFLSMSLYSPNLFFFFSLIVDIHL